MNKKQELRVIHRDDGYHEVRIGGVVKFVHHDEDRVRRWVSVRYPNEQPQWVQDGMLGRALGYQFDPRWRRNFHVG